MLIRKEDTRHGSSTRADRNQRVLSALWKAVLISPLASQPHFCLCLTVWDVEPDVTHQSLLAWTRSLAQVPEQPNGAECRGNSFVAMQLICSYRAPLDVRLSSMRDQDSAVFVNKLLPF